VRAAENGRESRPGGHPKQKNGAPKIEFASIQFWSHGLRKEQSHRSASSVHLNNPGKAKMEIPD